MIQSQSLHDGSALGIVSANANGEPESCRFGIFDQCAHVLDGLWMDYCRGSIDAVDIPHSSFRGVIGKRWRGVFDV